MYAESLARTWSNSDDNHTPFDNKAWEQSVGNKLGRKEYLERKIGNMQF